MAELHRLDDAIHDHRRPQPGPQAEKEHPAALIAAEGLHRRVIHDLHRPLERRLEVEADPARAEVVRFGHRSVVEHRPRVTHGHVVILQSFASALTRSTICFAVKLGPETNSWRSFCPVARILTWVPPT